MSWLNRPVTWKWYLGIAIVSVVLSMIAGGARRAPQMPKGVDQ
jgi:hypothetical protein